MEYKQIDSGLLQAELLGIDYISETDGDEQKPFGIVDRDMDGMVVATIARNAYMESGWFVSIIRGDDVENPTLYGFGFDKAYSTHTPSQLGYWALGLHLTHKGGRCEDYKVRVFNITTYSHTQSDTPLMYVYLNDIPFMTVKRGKSGTYFVVSFAEQFHKTIHKVTPPMVAIWTQYCTERLRYQISPPLPEPMLTGFTKMAMVLDQLLPK